MAYVSVDIDLDEFETYELVDEVNRRLKIDYGKKQLTKEQRKELKEAASDLLNSLNGTGSSYPNTTLEDKLKMDVVLSVWNKYTSWQLEEKLK